VGRVHAIGFALGVALASSGPALAPSPALEAPRAVDPCDALAASEIALDCLPAAGPWLDTSFLALDPLGLAPIAAPVVVSLPPLGERLHSASFAQVPEPAALLALGLGLGALAVLRRVPYRG
jgi:hypothetical protein